MARPRIVRADTIDLQDQHSPSAKDHTKQRAYSPSEGIAPHQELSIRHADQDLRSEIMQGPNGDGKDGRYHDGIDIYDEHEDMNGAGSHEHPDGSEDDDLADGEVDDLDDDLMDKISSSPSIDDEDIDFEFVYALHNFVATVEGQANAAKGDTMVLLDDSNSYWWLVRIVKDGSIGYLPAEHIETPTERLARLNKHRNVDLSATMLGDNSEKSKNPLKKAMRRRNAKSVSFSSPTYIEASDVDYDTEEEMEEGDFFDHDEESSRGEDDDDVQDDQHEDIVVEPLKPKSQREREKEIEESEDTEAHASEFDRTSSEKGRSSEDVELDENVSRSRNGTVRNTDSFFKDDSVETKKISLTPNLLRDEGGHSNEVKESRVSLETIDKDLIMNDKGREDKKRKEKKSGMFSGLFKKKDKKSKVSGDEFEESEKYSGESSRSSPPPKASLESMSPEQQTSRTPGPQPPKQTGKLQKQHPGLTSPTKSDWVSAAPDSTQGSGETILMAKEQAGQSLRRVASHETDSTSRDTREALSSPTVPTSPSTDLASSQARSMTSPIGPSSTRETSHERWQESYDRAGLANNSVMSPPQRFQPKLVPEYQDRSLESRRNVSPLEDLALPTGAPGLTRDISPREHSISPLSPPQSPGADAREPKATEMRAGSFDSDSEALTWSDASLRSYLDEHNDIHDLFVIVHDKSNIPPAGPDHPITGSLFKEESRRLKEMTSALDEMLVDWVGRRVQSSTLK